MHMYETRTGHNTVDIAVQSRDILYEYKCTLLYMQRYNTRGDGDVGNTFEAKPLKSEVEVKILHFPTCVLP